MSYRRISFYRSHNLEVPGSSPGWSTYKRLISNEIELFFRVQPPDYKLLLLYLFILFKAFVSLLFHQLNNMQYADNQSRNCKSTKTI